jgi:type VI secretion system secreted protein VgrG
MSVNSVSSGGSVHPDSSAEAWIGGVISAAEQQALGWKEYNFEEEAANGAGNTQQADGVDRAPPTAQERALEAFWGGDPNRPPSSFPSSSGSTSQPMSITDAEAQEMINVGYDVRPDGNGGWTLNLTTDRVDINQKPSQESVPLPGVSNQQTIQVIHPDDPRPPTIEPNGNTGSPAGAGSPDDEVDGVTGAGQAEGKKIDTVLDQKVEDLLDMSPSLRRLWEIAKNAGWKLELTNEGKSRAVKSDPPKVLINPADIKEGGDPFAKMASLVSHEMGHAGTPYQDRIEADNMADFVAKNVAKDLQHEGAAAFVNAKTRDEIIANGGPDIGIRGGLDEWYISVYEDYKAGRITESQAIDRMAELMAYEPDHEDGWNKQEILVAQYEADWKSEHPNE